MEPISSNRIARLGDLLGWSQQKLAGEIGLSQSQICRISAAGVQLLPRHERLCEALERRILDGAFGEEARARLAVVADVAPPAE